MRNTKFIIHSEKLSFKYNNYSYSFLYIRVLPNG